MDRTSRHPAKVRQRGAPGRIVQAPAQTSGACTRRPPKRRGEARYKVRRVVSRLTPGYQFGRYEMTDKLVRRAYARLRRCGRQHNDAIIAVPGSADLRTMDERCDHSACETATDWTAREDAELLATRQEPQANTLEPGVGGIDFSRRAPCRRVDDRTG